MRAVVNVSWPLERMWLTRPIRLCLETTVVPTVVQRKVVVEFTLLTDGTGEGVFPSWEHPAVRSVRCSSESLVMVFVPKELT